MKIYANYMLMINVKFKIKIRNEIKRFYWFFIR